MKALDSFTVERLEGLIGDAETWSFVKLPSRELKALARIALAAKKSEFEKVTTNQVQKRLIGWRLEDYTDETTNKEVARNWASAVGVLPIFEGDMNTNIEVKS